MGEDSIFNPYTRGLHRVGFEPTQLTLPGLKSGSLDHSDIGALNSLKMYSDLCTHINTTHMLAYSANSGLPDSNR